MTRCSDITAGRREKFWRLAGGKRPSRPRVHVNGPGRSSGEPDRWRRAMVSKKPDTSGKTRTGKTGGKPGKRELPEKETKELLGMPKKQAQRGEKAKAGPTRGKA